MHDSPFTPQATTALLTLRDFIRWGASRLHEAGAFFGHGTDNTIDEAAALVLHALHLPPDLADVYLPTRVTDAERRAILQLLERRVSERLPTAYLTREAWFMGLPFYVDERVLVPRSPLAELIEQRFEPWLAEPAAVGAILDLCTGSGCIGIACAYAFPDADVDLCDISSAALAVARRNVSEHGLDGQIDLFHADLFDELDDDGDGDDDDAATAPRGALRERRYDVIISNPPYVSDDELASLPTEYQREPALALAAGSDGLDCVRRLLRDAGRYLNDGGLLIVEVGSAQQALMDAYPDVPFVWLTFERGGDGVFLLDAAQLRHCQALF